MDIANASLLDEATAAAEAMTLSRKLAKNKGSVFFVSERVHPQTIDVLRPRAEPIGIENINGRCIGGRHANIGGRQRGIVECSRIPVDTTGRIDRGHRRFEERAPHVFGE